MSGEQSQPNPTVLPSRDRSEIDVDALPTRRRPARFANVDVENMAQVLGDRKSSRAAAEMVATKAESENVPPQPETPKITITDQDILDSLLSIKAPSSVPDASGQVPTDVISAVPRESLNQETILEAFQDVPVQSQYEKQRLVQGVTDLENEGLAAVLVVPYLLSKVSEKTAQGYSELLITLKNLNRQYRAESVSSALEKGVGIKDLPLYCEYQRSLEARQHMPGLDVLVHAQAKEHFFSILDQVAAAGDVNADSFALRSKEENNMLDIGVNAYSPNGRGGHFEQGLTTISMNNNEVQNGYGNFIWIMPTASVLSRDGFRFTSTAKVSLNGLAGEAGEIGILTPAGEAIEQSFLGKDSSVRKIMLGEVRQRVASDKLEVGIDLHRPEVFCLVPMKELAAVVERINELPIAEEQKHSLRLQIIPYRDDDELAIEMLAKIKANPQLFIDLVNRNGQILTAEQLALWESQLQAQNFVDVVGGVGYTYADVPQIDAVTISAEVQQMSLWEARADRLHLSELVAQMDKDVQVFFWHHLTVLTQTYFSAEEDNHQKLKQAECRSAISKYREALLKTTDQLNDQEKMVLAQAGINVEKVAANQPVLSFFKNEYFPGVA